MAFTDYTYYQKRLLAIPNLRDEVLDNLNDFIDIYEDEYLNKMLGIKLKNQFLAGLEETTIEDKWTNLLEGYEFEIGGIIYKWNGFQSSKKVSPIANYVFCHFVEQNQNLYTGIGTVIPNAENGNVITPQYRLSAVWSEMAKMNIELVNFLYEFEGSDYPDWDFNLRRTKSLLSYDYFIGF